MRKHFLCLLAAAVAAWSIISPARACDPETEGHEPGIFTVMLGGPDHDPAMAEAHLALAEFSVAPRFAVAGADGNGAIVQRIRFAGGETPEELKKFGWLGVQIGSVPKPLSDQLQLDGKGTVVMNVVDDSPADTAGIQQNDVIVAINDVRIEGGVENFIEAVRAHAPGDSIRVTVLRNGTETNFDNIVLGTRPDEPAMTWKFEFTPGTELEEHISTLGRVLMRDDKGNWTMHDLGELDDLPGGIAGLLPKAERRAMFMIDSADGGHQTLRINVQRDGETIKVSREDDGEIVVSRTDKDGNTTEATYANEDELKAGDEEAGELLSSHKANGRVQLRFGGPGAPGVDMTDLNSRLGELQVDIDVHMQEARKALDEAMKQAGAAALAVPHMGGSFNFEPGQAAAFVVGRPKHTFEVQEDGRIVVRIRKGDSELVQNFTGEADLQQRDPVLFEKYSDLMAADRE